LGCTIASAGMDIDTKLGITYYPHSCMAYGVKMAKNVVFGIFKFVVCKNFRGGFSVFFLKNPSKLKNFWVKGGTNPPIPPSGYAPGVNTTPCQIW